MKRVKLCTYAGLVVLVALLSACSAPEEHSGSSNTNATPVANGNDDSQPQTAQGSAPTAAPPAVQPIPPPSANSNSAIVPAAATTNPRAPKLVISAKKIDFGKQPQDKTLVRAIVVRNGGREDLKIESVVPS